MARCEGITKSGTRCKRTAPEGEAYCSIHADQAAASGAGQDARSTGGDKASGARRSEGRTRAIESGEDFFHMAVGMAVAAAIFWLIRRGIRFPGL